MRVVVAALWVFFAVAAVHGGEARIEPDQFHLDTIQGSEARSTVTNNGPGNQPAVMVSVSKLGTEFWSIELRAPGIAMESGKTYELKFQAKSTPARYVYFVPERTDGIQSSLAEGTTLEIPEDWTECAVLFHATDTAASGRLTLSNLSAVPASYWFSNFRLTEK
jgi:Carbohydrate binding domain